MKKVEDCLIYTVHCDKDSIVIAPMNKDNEIRIHGYKELRFFIGLLIDQSPKWKLFSVIRFLATALASVGAYKLLSQLYIRTH